MYLVCLLLKTLKTPNSDLYHVATQCMQNCLHTDQPCIIIPYATSSPLKQLGTQTAPQCPFDLLQPYMIYTVNTIYSFAFRIWGMGGTIGQRGHKLTKCCLCRHGQINSPTSSVSLWPAAVLLCQAELVLLCQTSRSFWQE